MQLQERFNEISDRYKPQFGATFSFFDISRNEALMEKAIALMQDALDGKRGAVTNQDIGFSLPDDAIS